MKKEYVSPAIKTHRFKIKNIICYSINGEADPNKPALSKESAFYWDDDECE